MAQAPCRRFKSSGLSSRHLLMPKGHGPFGVDFFRFRYRHLINPPFLALKRRAEELHSSACREMPVNPECGGLLLFYAAECSLKAAYMYKNNLRHTGEQRGQYKAARSFVHNLKDLVTALNIPAASLPKTPEVFLVRNGERNEISDLHQAWRYGEKIRETATIIQWLTKLIEWCKKNT